jgi:hypothetical protein
MLGKVSLGLGLVLAIAACGAARLVQRTPYGGVLELQGDRGRAMEHATTEMNAHCGVNNYTIIQEGEEPVVGSNPYASPNNGPYGSGPPQGTRYPWRVHYQCNNAGAPEAMPAAAPAPDPAPPPPPPPDGDYY